MKVSSNFVGVCVWSIGHNAHLNIKVKRKRKNKTNFIAYSNTKNMFFNNFFDENVYTKFSQKGAS